MTSPDVLMQKIMGDQNYNLVDGGWGFDREDSMVFAKASNKEGHNRDDLTVLERTLVEVRNTEEFTRSPGIGSRFEVMGFELESQITLRDKKAKKYYDRIIGTVFLIAEQDLPELIDIADRYNARDPEAIAAYKAKTVAVKREYWFDITKINRQSGGRLAKKTKPLEVNS